MRSQLLADDEARIHVVVLDTGEEAMRELCRFAREHAIDAAHFTAIGAFREASLGWFDIDIRDYHVNEVSGQAEVVSLVGDITRSDESPDEPMVHAHVVLGLRDGRALGGHLLSGHVRPTLEVMVTETPASLRRRHDPATGLALIDASRSPDDTFPITPAGASHVQNRR